jgi:uncharacterized small protein (DUF1192 family)
LPVDALAAEVERVLCDLSAQFQRMIALADQRRQAMSRADTAGLARCITEENVAVQTVAEIEKRRITAVGRLAERLSSPAQTQTRMSWLAERLGGPIGERMARHVAELKKQIETLKKANEIARLAAQNLSSHMEGLWRQASQVLNHSQSYGRRGVVEPGASVVSAVDLRS